MKNYITIDGHQVELTGELVEHIKALFVKQNTTLLDIADGDTFKIGEHEFIVLEHLNDGTTAVILNGLLPDAMEFGKNNNYNGSYVDDACNKFAETLAAIIGAENIVEHTVDLTSNDGLDDYGQVERLVSLLTADRYRRYVKILDKFKVDAWWWLATPFSTKAHSSDIYALCVSPSGYVIGSDNVNIGVRPFCILNSDIFVSH